MNDRHSRTWKILSYLIFSRWIDRFCSPSFLGSKHTCVFTVVSSRKRQSSNFLHEETSSRTSRYITVMFTTSYHDCGGRQHEDCVNRYHHRRVLLSSVLRYFSARVEFLLASQVCIWQTVSYMTELAHQSFISKCVKVVRDPITIGG